MKKNQPRNLEIAMKRLAPGVLIFNRNNRLVFSNNEALNMLPSLYSKTGRGRSKGPNIPEEICSLLHNLKIKSNPQSHTSSSRYKKGDRDCNVMFMKQERVFSLRAFFIGEREQAGDSAPSHIMVLIEGLTEKRHLDLEKTRKDFNISSRELDVLTLICQGYANKAIGDKLFISEYTVKDHIKKIMEKMCAKSRSEIIALVI